MTSRALAIQIFDEHFNIHDYEDISFIYNNFQFLKEEVIQSIIKKMIEEVPYETYEDYMLHDDTYEVNLLTELTPFISSKIKYDILWKYHENDNYNSTGESNMYYYTLTHEVVEDIINNLRPEMEENEIDK